jgi:uncharacterized spore protein YtfJ
MAMETQERTQLVNDLLERVGQTVGERAHVSTIFGEAVEREGVTVIPVAKARFGFGGGGGSGSREGDEGSGGGGGGGVAVGPIATSRCATAARSSSESPARRTRLRSSPRLRSRC